MDIMTLRKSITVKASSAGLREKLWRRECMSRSKRTPLTVQDRAQWREKVREECLQRAMQHRQDMLWRMRQVIHFHGV
jgi:hypothetical protein